MLDSSTYGGREEIPRYGGIPRTWCRCETSSHGQNPANPWLGVSPLAALAPEIWINREATRMTAALLKNMGQVGIAVIAKPLEGGDQISEDDAKAMKKYLREAYSGSNRGDSMFIEFPAEIHGGELVDPDMMHPKTIFDYVQEMVCSIYRLPAAVLQFGVGLEAATQNATMVQLEKQAWETGILPVQWALASQIGRQLLPSFGLDVATYRLASTRPRSRCSRRTARTRRRCGGS